MKITFRGATQTVTGSLHQVEIGGKTFILDCGMFQGPRSESRRINCCFDFDPRQVEAVILSHAHIDHCGNLPNLVKQGFRGRIYCTRATAAITALMIMDAAKIQEEDAAYLNQKTQKGWQGKIEPLFTREDAERTIELFTSLEYRRPRDFGVCEIELRDAGHTLGSAAVRVTEKSSGRVLVFSGDIGRPASPVLRDPETFEKADAVICESTYGGRKHRPPEEAQDQLAAVINETVKAGGPLLVPAFALGRTQTMLQQIHELRDAKRIPGWLPVYVDSPLASRVTEVYRRFEGLFDDETKQMLQPFNFPNLKYVADPQESRSLNRRNDPFVVIAGSGMCESGRILHHLKHHIARPQTTVLLPGFQAPSTLGRRIQERQQFVNILGDSIPLRARVETLDGLSAHADSEELRAWLRPLKSDRLRTFLVHGEMRAAEALRAELQAAGFGEVGIPARGDVVEV